MCIKYNKTVTAEIRKRGVDEITVYKVYLVSDGRLMSPYNSGRKGGCVSQDGEIKAENPFDTDVKPVHIARRWHTDHTVSYPRRDLPEGVRLHAYGIHCFLRRKNAVEWHAARAFSPTNPCVIVPLKAKVKDLIIGGYEDVYETATFKKAVITKAAFRRAIKTSQAGAK